MKKVILAFVALAFAFALSSCCDQSYCPGNLRCKQADEQAPDQETPYRWDKGPQERPRRW
jgi:hypothetical protein